MYYIAGLQLVFLPSHAAFYCCCRCCQPFLHARLTIKTFLCSLVLCSSSFSLLFFFHTTALPTQGLPNTTVAAAVAVSRNASGVSSLSLPDFRGDETSTSAQSISVSSKKKKNAFTVSFFLFFETAAAAHTFVLVSNKLCSISTFVPSIRHVLRFASAAADAAAPV